MNENLEKETAIFFEIGIDHPAHGENFGTLRRSAYQFGPPMSLYAVSYPTHKSVHSSPVLLNICRHIFSLFSIISLQTCSAAFASSNHAACASENSCDPFSANAIFLFYLYSKRQRLTLNAGNNILCCHFGHFGARFVGC